jgi:hypothetical protein
MELGFVAINAAGLEGVSNSAIDLSRPLHVSDI